MSVLVAGLCGPVLAQELAQILLRKSKAVAPAYPAESLPTRLAFLRPLLTWNTRLVGLGVVIV